MLGGALGGGALAALGGLPAAAFPAARPGATLILAHPSAGPGFAGAVAAWTGGTVRTVAGPETLAEAAGWLAAAPGRRVVGLVDAAHGVLFQQMAPRGRVAWLSESHHLPAGGHGRAAWELALGEALGRAAAERRPTVVAPHAGGPAGALMSFVVAG
jgi:hypothetical protein